MAFSSTTEYDAVETLINMFDESIDTNVATFESQIDIIVDILIDWTSLDSYTETVGEDNRKCRMLTAFLYIWSKHSSESAVRSVTQVGAVKVETSEKDGYWMQFKNIADRYDVTVNQSSMWRAVASKGYVAADYRISKDIPDAMQ